MSLGLGLATLLRERRSGASVAFMVMQAAVATWLFTSAVIYLTTNADAARVWLRILPFGLVCIPVAVLAFSVAVTEQWRRRWPIVAVAAAVSVCFAIAGNAFHSFFTEDVHEYFWGYSIIAGPGVILYGLYQTSCLLGAAAILWKAQSETRSVVRRGRLRALFLGLMISYLSGIDFLPTAGIAVYPFGYMFIAVFVVLGTRAIWRYRLVDLTPEMAAHEIVETMSEALLVVDVDRVIRVANRATGTMLGVPPSELIGAKLTEVKGGTLARLAGVHHDGLATAELDIDGAEGTITVIVSASLLRGHAGELLGTIFTAYDITERKRAEEAVTKSESLYRTLVETSPDSVTVTDAQGIIVMANRGAARLLRVDSADDLIGLPAFDFVIEEDTERMRETLASVSQSQVLQSSEYTLQLPGGERIPVELSLSRIRDAGGEVDGFMAIARDITERRRAEETIQHLAYHDGLTGLANRSLLVERLSSEMEAAIEDGLSLSVLYMDLDGMKAINDTYGHATGDDVLRDAAARLRSLIREETDILARVGGDEFVLAIPRVRNEDEVSRVAERILDSIKQPFTPAPGECTLSMSIGIAIYPRDGEEIEELLSCADAAMYAAKDRGGNAYIFAPSSDGLARAV
jgi:diguanylate cyclase (GGDEF)-like protein/PAS domain S-box-containing protein